MRILMVNASPKKNGTKRKASVWASRTSRFAEDANSVTRRGDAFFLRMV